ncbi:MAG: phospholipase D-like domain-containing protein [Armatimonadota bacterium]
MRGTTVRLIYHAKPKDKQTTENEENLSGLKAINNAEVIARNTNAIFHDKFIVLSRLEGDQRKPQAVLCGSTNFTYNGVYCQANVIHIVERDEIAQSYLKLFDHIADGADQSATKQFISDNNTIDPKSVVFAGFSPRAKQADLKEFVRTIKSTKRDVLFSTAFEMHRDIQDALLGQAHDSILRYGLSNSELDITGYHADRTANFTSTAYLDEGLDGWLRETMLNRGGRILIHTKVVVVDFTSDAPTVISGSHNLSNNASANNDENYLIIRGDSDVADCYGCEVMRLYDHYRFRYSVKIGTGHKVPALVENDSWTDRYFGGDNLATLDRIMFAG